MPLADAQWVRIEPLLLDRMPQRGGRWRDHREMIDATAFKFRTGSQWGRLPEKYGNRQLESCLQPARGAGRRRHLRGRVHRAECPGRRRSVTRMGECVRERSVSVSSRPQRSCDPLMFRGRSGRWQRSQLTTGDRVLWAALADGGHNATGSGVSARCWAAASTG
ncbi:transposase [Streptomyces sp. NPDC101227]|uniref:transposase n=1 Tax=Streptomyces sp. NPDC101227 TaxID=3366136 RepID=UPI00380BEB66